MSDDTAESAEVGRPAARRFDWTRARATPTPRWWSLAAAAAIAWLTWPVASFIPENGLDPSWQIALSLAADHRLDFGHDIVFSYGPLGFLAHPRLVTTPTAVGALLFAAVAQFALCAVVLWRARRSFPWYVAVLVTYVVGAMLAASGFSNLGDYAVFVVFVLAVHLLEQEQPAPTWLIPLGGFLAAFQLLVKVSGGFIALALLALAVWRARPGGWRAELLLLGSFMTSLVVLWVAVGSALGDLPRWLYESAHVVGAYTSAMALEAGSGGLYLQAIALLAVAAGLVVARTRGLGTWRTASIAAACALYAFAYFKEGFVRLDAIHAALFFSAFAIALVAITWGPPTRWVAAALLAASLGAVAAVTEGSEFFYRPGARLGTAADEVDALFHSGREISEGKAVVRDQLGLDDATLRLLRGHTVDVQPYETSAVWAYELEWRPQPLIQSYVALDHELDRFNARALASRGAERILLQQQQPALDGRHPLYLAPESSLVILCRYRQLHVQGEWETLGRAGDRCGPSRRLRSVDADQGERVAVPQTSGADELVYARIHIRKTLKQRLADFVFKTIDAPGIVLDGATYRLVSDVAQGPLILRMAKNSGIAPSFGGDLNVSALTLANVPSPYRVDFFALRLRG
jgi:hypothetical protein